MMMTTEKTTTISVPSMVVTWEVIDTLDMGGTMIEEAITCNNDTTTMIP